MKTTKSPVRVIAGMRGAIRRMEGMVVANKYDISQGFAFHALLAQNERKLAAMKEKLAKYRSSLQ